MLLAQCSLDGGDLRTIISVIDERTPSAAAANDGDEIDSAACLRIAAVRSRLVAYA